MTELRYARLDERGVVAVEGPDAVAFLQGLVSNDVRRLAPERTLYAALLTPQGKFLHDFFLFRMGEAILIDCEGARRGDFMRRLGIYKLRSKITLVGRDDLAMFALFGDGAAAAIGLAAEAGAAAPLDGGIACVDPRMAAAGVRALLTAAGAEDVLENCGFAPADAAVYDRHRLTLGLPDGSRDMEVEKATLMESGFDSLNGIDWGKGCFMGQELTARTRYRGLVKKRLTPVAVEGPPPPPGTPVTLDGRDAGELRSALDGLGLALLRLESLQEATASGASFVAGEARLRPRDAA